MDAKYGEYMAKKNSKQHKIMSYIVLPLIIGSMILIAVYQVQEVMDYVIPDLTPTPMATQESEYYGPEIKDEDIIEEWEDPTQTPTPVSN